jgi:hypothetical protein
MSITLLSKGLLLVTKLHYSTNLLICIIIKIEGFMTNEELESRIKEFVEIAEKLPERYREKCFEVLLSNFLIGGKMPQKAVEGVETPTVSMPANKFVIPIDVRALFQQYNIPEDSIQKLFFTEGEEVRPTYTIKTTKKADAQIQLALLTALENALKPDGRFEFAMETVREKCREHKVYDQPNFKTIFKNNKKFFKDLSDEEHVELSPDGKTELADVILAIIQ